MVNLREVSWDNNGNLFAARHNNDEVNNNRVTVKSLFEKVGKNQCKC